MFKSSFSLICCLVYIIPSLSDISWDIYRDIPSMDGHPLVIKKEKLEMESPPNRRNGPNMRKMSRFKTFLWVNLDLMKL